RTTLGGRGEIPGSLALSVALPPGAARLDRRTLGGKSRPAAPPLLSFDEGRSSGAGGTAARMARIRGSDPPDHGLGTCLSIRTGERKSPGVWPASICGRSERPRLSPS